MSQEWYPILDYETEPKGLADKELRALSGVWVEQRSKLSESDNISKFTERLKREWAIETGLIERLYTLDHGITELMIERGVNAALIPRHVADDPGHIVAMIDDQENAVESVFAFVKGDRQLSTSYVKELHQVFTRHQEFVEGRASGRCKYRSFVATTRDNRTIPRAPTGLFTLIVLQSRLRRKWTA